MHPPLPEDKRAGYVGLIAGFISIVITVMVIVELTNRKFDSHEAAPHAPPAAGAPAQGAPPPPGGGAAAPAPAPH
jgi:hypothetical protein